MILRFIYLVILACLLILTGCNAGGNSKTTGFAYILEQAKRPAGPVAPVAEQAGRQNGEPGGKDEIINGNNKYEPVQIGKKVFLTFDDGPDFLITPLILDILDYYGIKATFFVVGTSVEKHPDILKQVAEGGHAIGNHTYSHKYGEIYSRIDGLLNSVRQNEEVIYSKTGQRPRIVRDPGGHVRNNKKQKELLAGNGYSLVGWNIDSYDSRKPHPDAGSIIENVRIQVAEKRPEDDLVILFHDGKGHLATVRALPTIIEMLKAEGYYFEVLK